MRSRRSNAVSSNTIVKVPPGSAFSTLEIAGQGGVTGQPYKQVSLFQQHGFVYVSLSYLNHITCPGIFICTDPSVIPKSSKLSQCSSSIDNKARPFRLHRQIDQISSLYMLESARTPVSGPHQVSWSKLNASKIIKYAKVAICLYITITQSRQLPR